MSDAQNTARQAIREVTRVWYSQLRDNHPDKHLYALSFCFHDDFVGTSLWANSMEALQAKSEDLDEEYAWNPAEWKYSMAFDSPWEALAIYDSAEPIYIDDATLKYRARCLGATIGGLKDLADEGLFGRGSEGVLVFLTIWDSAEYNWLIRESVRRINSSELYFAHQLEPKNWLGENVFNVVPPGQESRRRSAKQTDLAAAYYAIFGQ